MRPAYLPTGIEGRFRMTDVQLFPGLWNVVICAHSQKSLAVIEASVGTMHLRQ